jgi:hypothetical protein
MKVKLIICAYGSNSSTQRFLCPGFGDLRPLLVPFIGVVVNFTLAKISLILEIDPLMFQGCYPDLGTIMYYSVLSKPECNRALRAKNHSSALRGCLRMRKTESLIHMLRGFERLSTLQSLSLQF